MGNDNKREEGFSVHGDDGAAEITRAVVVVPVLTSRERREAEESGTPHSTLSPLARLEDPAGT